MGGGERHAGAILGEPAADVTVACEAVLDAHDQARAVALVALLPLGELEARTGWLNLRGRVGSGGRI